MKVRASGYSTPEFIHLEIIEMNPLATHLALRSRLTFTALVLCILAGPVSASDWDASLGLSGGSIQRHVKGENDQHVVVPYADLRWGMMMANPEGIGLVTSPTSSSRLKVMAQLRQSVFDPDDNKVLAALDDRDDTGELLIKWEQATPWVDLAIFASADVLDRHGGHEWGIAVSRELPAWGGALVPSIDVRQQSQRLVDYYYGVSQQEASANIAAYEGEKSVVMRTSVSHVQKLGSDWHSVFAFGYEHLGDGAGESSIVERKGFWSGGVAIFYQF